MMKRLWRWLTLRSGKAAAPAKPCHRHARFLRERKHRRQRRFITSSRTVWLEHLPFDPDSQEVFYVDFADASPIDLAFRDRNYARDVQFNVELSDVFLMYMPRLEEFLREDVDACTYRLPQFQGSPSIEAPSRSNDYMTRFFVHPEALPERLFPCLLKYEEISKGEGEYKFRLYPIPKRLVKGNVGLRELMDFFRLFASQFRPSTPNEPTEEESPMAIRRSEETHGRTITNTNVRFSEEFEDDIDYPLHDRPRRRANGHDEIRFSLSDRPAELRTADDRFDEETNKLLDSARTTLARLRTKGLSDHILQQLLLPRPKLSRLLVTKDLRIVLPDYNDMEISMTPLVKAVYLLFLRHDEGIPFKSLIDYRDELKKLYTQTLQSSSSPTFPNKRTMKISIDALVNPFDNSINEKCARIKEAFLTRFHNSIADHYCITGKRGMPKHILLPKDMVDWETEGILE